MYSSSVQALRAACHAMATDTCVTTALWGDLLGGIIKDKSDLNKWDRIAQGVFTMSLARKHARLHSRYLLQAVYYPLIPEFKVEKELSCKLVSWYVHEELDRRIDRWFIDDVTRKYCGFKMRHTDTWWAEHMGKSDRQVRRYKNEKILTVLDGLHDTLINDIEPIFIENEIVN